MIGSDDLGTRCFVLRQREFDVADRAWVIHLRLWRHLVAGGKRKAKDVVEENAMPKSGTKLSVNTSTNRPESFFFENQLQSRNHE